MEQQLHKHPDVFTADEAAVYLHLENASTLEWLRDNGHLASHKIGKSYMYWREDLDLCARSMFGRGTAPKTAGKAEGRAAMKLVGQR